MDYSKFENQLGDWGPSLRDFIESKECDKLYAFLKAERKREKQFCPDTGNIYRVFRETPPDKLKAVFWLLDPYPRILQDGTRVADGIAMSCGITQKSQPSLDLFYNGIEDDLFGGLKLDYEREMDLKYLCEQGVMLINTALTVEAGKTGSHVKAWRPFMKYLCEEVFAKMPNGMVFALCGKESQDMAKFINPLQHVIYELEHPAFAARQMREWKHQGIFHKINYHVEVDHKEPINWLAEPAPF